MLSYHNRMKLEINNVRKLGKLTNTWKLSNIQINNQWVKELIWEVLERHQLPKLTQEKNMKQLTMNIKIKLGGQNNKQTNLKEKLRAKWLTA